VKYLASNIRSIAIATLAVLALAQGQVAAAWSDHVVAACSDAQNGGSDTSRAVCHAYIEGFLDGALVTDTAIVKNVGGEEDIFSSYTLRALRTRVGQVRAPLPATFLADFCLPEEVGRSTVVTDLAEELAVLNFAAEPITEAVYRQIKQSYPCPP
jgi:hypothetical protein